MIKQDFIAVDLETNDVTCYSGQGGIRGKHLNIREFCKKYGRSSNGEWGQYECDKETKHTPLHWFDSVDSHGIPGESEFRKALEGQIKELEGSI